MSVAAGVRHASRAGPAPGPVSPCSLVTAPAQADLGILLHTDNAGPRWLTRERLGCLAHQRVRTAFPTGRRSGADLLLLAADGWSTRPP